MREEVIGAIELGLACVAHKDLTWLYTQSLVSDSELTEIFREEFKKANYPVVGDPNALFDDPSE